MSLPLWSRVHKCVAQCYEVGPVIDLFCENVLYVEISRSMDNFYFVDMDSLSDMVITENDMFNSFYREEFLLAHKGMVVIVQFSWKLEVDV